MKTVKIKNLLFKSLVFFALLCIFPPSAFGIGQTTDPIIINDALRGGTFQKEMIVVNTDKEASLIDIKAEGDISGWVKFFKKNDLKNPIAAILLQAGENANLFAEITIPKDIKNGKYSGFIGVIKKPKEESGSGTFAFVAQKIDRRVNITVNDKENIEIKASVIPEKYDLDEKEPLKVRLIYDNQGNVSIKTDLNFKIKKDEKILFNITYPFSEDTEAIKPKAVYEVPSIEVPTSMLKKGKYVAEIDFVVDKKTISTERFKFIIGKVMEENAPDKAVTGANNNYLNWIISGLAGLFTLTFMIYSFSKAKKKKEAVKKVKIIF